jgi:hypothetical protein
MATDRAGPLAMQMQQDMGHLEGAFAAVSAPLEGLPKAVWPVFLAKLVLILSDKLDDAEDVAAAVDVAARDLDRA